LEANTRKVRNGYFLSTINRNTGNPELRERIMSNADSKKTPRPKRVAIQIPTELKAVYANVAFISHTPAEIVIDFAQVLPRMEKGDVVSRVVMSPIHAKLLNGALGQNIANFERQFGEIKLPQSPSLADQLFRFPPQNPGEDEPDADEEA
jgi:hypothetical protein